eukprot:2488281-Prymnesium_polylepis.1
MEGLRMRLVVAAGDRVDRAQKHPRHREDFDLIHLAVAHAQPVAIREQAQMGGPSQVLLLHRVLDPAIRHLVWLVQLLVRLLWRSPIDDGPPIASAEIAPLPHVDHPALGLLGLGIEPQRLLISRDRFAPAAEPMQRCRLARVRLGARRLVLYRLAGVVEGALVIPQSVLARGAIGEQHGRLLLRDCAGIEVGRLLVLRPLVAATGHLF